MTKIANQLTWKQLGYLQVYLKHNKTKMLKNYKRNPRSIVLFEEFIEFPRFIAFSYFANYWMKKGNTLVSYRLIPDSNLYRGLRTLLSGFLLPGHQNYIKRKVFSSMGIELRIKPKILKLSSTELADLLSLVGKDQESVLKYSYLGIPIGENFYDWYLRDNKVETVDTNNPHFLRQLVWFVGLAKWWYFFFQKEQVEALNISHSVYVQGMIARIAIFNQVKVYVVSFDKCYRLSDTELHSEGEFSLYDPNRLEFFNYEIDLSQSRAELVRLKRGDSFVTKEHSVVSGFRNPSNDFKIDRDSNTIHALIATHCFTESVHQQGALLFADYYSWTLFMANSTLNSPYSWYIKAHPYFNEAELAIFKKLVSDFPHLVEIPSDVSITHLFSQGINVVFTAYGTIGFDASILGIPVVAASTNATYKNYRFCIQPSNKLELESIILNLGTTVQKHLISEKELLHYFSVHHLRQVTTWLFGNHLDKLIHYLGHYTNIFNDTKVFFFWVNKIWSPEIHNFLMERVETFIEGDSYFMDGHFKGTIDVS